ncbi:UNVERIFIED_CONTAM: hypothetical protein GTU68_050979 [Idotea baltica]|nr:hypothetical protein [Idotea baltica]
MSPFTTLVSVDQLAENLKAPSSNRWVIIDCRFSLADTSQGETHFQISRIPGAQYAHLDHHLSSAIIPSVTGRHPLPNVDEIEAQFKRWGINNDTQIVAYDDKLGAQASRLWWLSRWLGHDACAVLDGGFAAWKQAGASLETSSPTKRDAGQFKKSKSLFSVIEKHKVLDANVCLLDAREVERYRGEHEPIDPVAGHIPGALNGPFIENVDTAGKFKSVTELQQRFDSILADKNDKQLVHYCGSGVTAAHNMLAMAYAQRDPGALYAGSFSEWVSQPNDDQFPVARLVD